MRRANRSARRRKRGDTARLRAERGGKRSAPPDRLPDDEGSCFVQLDAAEGFGDICSQQPERTGSPDEHPSERPVLFLEPPQNREDFLLDELVHLRLRHARLEQPGSCEAASREDVILVVDALLDVGATLLDAAVSGFLRERCRVVSVMISPRQ